jgi:hypothetical protein
MTTNDVNNPRFEDKPKQKTSKWPKRFNLMVPVVTIIVFALMLYLGVTPKYREPIPYETSEARFVFYSNEELKRSIGELIGGMTITNTTEQVLRVKQVRLAQGAIKESVSKIVTLQPGETMEGEFNPHRSAWYILNENGVEVSYVKASNVVKS